MSTELTASRLKDSARLGKRWQSGTHRQRTWKMSCSRVGSLSDMDVNLQRL